MAAAARRTKHKVTKSQFDAARDWVVANCSGARAAGSFHQTLLNGVYMAKLAFKVDSGSIAKRCTTPQKKSMAGAFGQNEARERIGEVIKAFRKMGIAERYLFNPNDLLEAHDLDSVYRCLCQVSCLCEKRGVRMLGKAIHIKEATKQKSTLTEAKKRKARGTVPRMAVTRTMETTEGLDSRGVIMHSSFTKPASGPPPVPGSRSSAPKKKAVSSAPKKRVVSSAPRKKVSSAPKKAAKKHHGLW